MYIATRYNGLWYVTEVTGSIQVRLYPLGNKRAADLECQRLNRK